MSSPDARLQRAEQLRINSQTKDARAICKALVRKHPNYVGAQLSLGLSYASDGNYEAAMPHIAKAAALNPLDYNVLAAAGELYLRLGAVEMSRSMLEMARSLAPDEPVLHAILGETYKELQEYDLARQSFKKAANFTNGNTEAMLGYASCCQHLDDFDEAAKVYKTLVDSGVNSIELLLGICSLPKNPTQIDLPKLISDTRAMLGKLACQHENSLQFAEALDLHWANKHAQAWERFVLANQRANADVEEENRVRSSYLRGLAERLGTAKLLGSSPTPADDTPITLLILGPPRSGKTTLEGLLAVQDKVKRGFESPVFDMAVRSTFQSAGLLGGDKLAELPAALDGLFRERYLSVLRAKTDGATVFTNTHPSRVIDAPRFACSVPGVRMIFVRRRHDDLIFRIFIKQFRDGHPYAYEIDAIMKYILWYEEMSDIIVSRFPSIAKIINYEDMIKNPTSTLMEVSDFCGIESYFGEIPLLPDDRNCSDPYLERMFVT